MSAAKGKRLEARSRRWLRLDGAVMVFRGKGERRGRSNPAGCPQVDLIALYRNRTALVEVTVASNRARARRRLQSLPRVEGVLAYVHVWRPRASEPQIEFVWEGLSP